MLKDKNKWYRSCAVGALALAAGGFAGAAWGQTTTTLAIEEITVTAQKRSENLQEVPIAISAFSESMLDRSGVDNIADLALQVPSMQFTNFSSIAYIAIRGVGYENTTAGGDPGVAFHQDGVYLGRPVATLFDAWDLERVEILRGPQGTLYGRNATGGSVNFISKRPEPEFGAKVEGIYGKFDRIVGRGMLNVPISQNVATRFTVFAEDRRGYQKNLVEGGTRANDAENFSIRGQVLANVTDAIEWHLVVNYANNGGVGFTTESRLPFPGPEVFGPPGVADNWVGFVNGGGPSFGGLVNDLEANVVSKNTPESQDLEALTIASTLSWDLGAVTLKSVTGYAETSFDNFLDLDASERDLLNIALFEDQDQFSQELQISSNGNGKLDWIVGAFFFREEASRFSTIFNSDFDAFGASIGRDAGFRVGGDVVAKSYALFAQATYDITPKLQITGGFRFSWDRKNALIDILSAFPNPNPPTNSAVIIDDGPAGGKWSEPTGKVAINWFAMEDVMLYGSFSRGYKGGGINLNAVPTVINPDTGNSQAVYNPEFIDSFEIGAKTTIGGRAQVNVSAFYNDYSDLQVQTFGNAGAIIANAAEATIKGIEIDATVLVTETIEFNLGGAYLDAQFDEFPFRGPQGQQLDFSGNRLTRSPEFSFNAGAQKEFLLPNEMGMLTFRAEFYYQDQQHFNVNNAPITLADSYSNLDLRLSYRSSDEKITAEVFVTNVTNEDQIRDILLSIPFMDNGVDLTTYAPPRQWGIRLGYAF
ncbi:MAG: TonB-dependent receptor [Sphingomonadales bacterium]